MLNEDDYELFKGTLVDSKRLFDKLCIVAKGASELDYDESGLYTDDEERLQRHWLKLSTKITNALSQSLSEYSIELMKNDELEIKKLSFALIKDDIKSKIDVDYSEDGALNIIQID
jgi:hypothetical protein